MAEGREANGQFAKGNQISKGGNGGRPPKAREERYYEILQSTCTFKEWERIAQKAVDQAEAGDAVARKWLSDYLIGPPTQSHDIRSSGEVTIQVEYKDGTHRNAKKP